MKIITFLVVLTFTSMAFSQNKVMERVEVKENGITRGVEVIKEFDADSNLVSIDSSYYQIPAAEAMHNKPSSKSKHGTLRELFKEYESALKSKDTTRIDSFFGPVTIFDNFNKDYADSIWVNSAIKDSVKRQELIESYKKSIRRYFQFTPDPQNSN